MISPIPWYGSYLQIWWCWSRPPPQEWGALGRRRGTSCWPSPSRGRPWGRSLQTASPRGWLALRGWKGARTPSGHNLKTQTVLEKCNVMWVRVRAKRSYYLAVTSFFVSGTDELTDKQRALLILITKVQVSSSFLAFLGTSQIHCHCLW